LLEQRELVVEAVRIEIAVRSAQSHHEAPALAGAQGLAWLDQRRVLVVAGVPAERERRRHARWRAVAVDDEAKAQAARPCCGRLATTPVTTMSRPSIAGGSVSARRSDAGQPADAKPASAPAATTTK